MLTRPTVVIVLLVFWALVGCHDDDGPADRPPPVDVASPERPAAIEGRIEQRPILSP